jgi:hypothetical protein
MAYATKKYLGSVGPALELILILRRRFFFSVIGFFFEILLQTENQKMKGAPWSNLKVIRNKNLHKLHKDKT